MDMKARCQMSDDRGRTWWVRVAAVLLLSVVCLLSSVIGGEAASTIDPTQPAEGNYSTAAVRAQLLNATNDVNGILAMHAGPTPPPNPLMGELWINTYSAPPYPVNVWIETAWYAAATLNPAATPPLVWTIPAGSITSSMLASGAAASNVGTVGGDLSGSLPNPAVASGAVTSGKMAAGAAAANVGALGGDLGGTLPNPTIAANAVTNAKAAQANGNSVKGNPTGSLANEQDIAMPGCSDTGGNHLNWVSGTGPTCGTSSSGAGAWTPVLTLSAPAPSFAWTGLSGYGAYFLKCSGVQPSANGASLSLRLGFGGTPTYDNTGYYGAGWYANTSTGAFQQFNNVTGVPLNSNTVVNTTNKQWSAEITIEGANVNGVMKHVVARARYTDTITGLFETKSADVLDTITMTVLTGIEIFPDSGTFLAGSCSLDGHL